MTWEETDILQHIGIILAHPACSQFSLDPNSESDNFAWPESQRSRIRDIRPVDASPNLTVELEKFPKYKIYFPDI